MPPRKSVVFEKRGLCRYGKNQFVERTCGWWSVVYVLDEFVANALLVFV